MIGHPYRPFDEQNAAARYVNGRIIYAVLLFDLSVRIEIRYRQTDLSAQFIFEGRQHVIL